MDPIDYPEMEHAPYSPSSLKYYALCPSWQQGDSEEAGEQAGLRGTAVHRAFETGDMSHCQTEIEIACAKKAMAYVELIKRQRITSLSRN